VRFFAGLGLAGELGAAITLVSEIMHKEKRGYGTMVIVTMGALGAVAAAQLKNADVSAWGLANWQMMYLIGGGLGLALLLMRMGTFESGMFDEMKKSTVTKGNFLILFNDKKRFFRYLACILIGLPVWYCIGVLMKFADKFALELGVTGEKITIPNAIMYAYIGLSVGDLLSGILSQVFRSRKKIVFYYLIATTVLVIIFLFGRGMTSTTFYFLCFLLGSATGYWALFVTMASEQFGTNIRATVTTTVPNFVRGANIPIIASYVGLAGGIGTIGSALTVGLVCIGLALIALFTLPETFGKDLNYTELS
jgi:MFS family permease